VDIVLVELHKALGLCLQVELHNVRSFYKEAQKSPFKFFPWKTGNMHFKFLPVRQRGGGVAWDGAFFVAWEGRRDRCMPTTWYIGSVFCGHVFTQAF
jgi:hypothetical protein